MELKLNYNKSEHQHRDMQWIGHSSSYTMINWVVMIVQKLQFIIVSW